MGMADGLRGWADVLSDASESLRVYAEQLENLPPPPPPPPVFYDFEILAENMRMVNVQSMVFETVKPGHTGKGSFGFWGRVGEAVEFDINVLTDDTVEDLLTLRFANCGTTPTRRRLTLYQGSTERETQELIFPNKGQWSTPEQWQEQTWKTRLPKGRYTVKLECIADWEFLDLDWARIKSSQVVEKPDIVIPPPPPDPPPPPPYTNLEEALERFFPGNIREEEVHWGQDLRDVPPGTTLILRDTDIRGSEWILRGLRGTPEAWITIKAESVWGFKARELEVWRGLGIYGCQYVRVDGLDFYGSGKIHPNGSGDFVAAVECVGGHHIAATRNRAFNTGGHCIAGTWGESMEGPANMYILYNVALETSRRNPFNGSAYSMFHSTSQAGGDGPLSLQGYTDYVIGNVAFGCESLVADPHWGITDGNMFILDQCNSVGWNGKCLVAFNVGADNGGRAVHAVNSNNMHALFNTGVGNQKNVDGQNGEFTTQYSHGQVFGGNIAAATTRTPAHWFEDWTDDHPGVSAFENVVLAGTSTLPNNPAPHPLGLDYLVGATTTSRNIEDYRPHVGNVTPLVDRNLVQLFERISAHFPDASGIYRDEAICGALDALR